MNEWTQSDIEDHLANQNAMITIQTNQVEIQYRQVQTLSAAILLMSIWIGYCISAHFTPTKRDIAG